MRYTKGEIVLNKIQTDFKIKWCICGTSDKWNNGEVEKINIEVINGSNKIDYNFYNSLMEKELSDKLQAAKDRMTPQEFISAIRNGYFRPHMWAGYDKGLSGRKISNISELNKKRIYYFLNSVLVDLAGYYNWSDHSPTFEDFCSEFGYDKDLRKSEAVYNACIRMDK